MDVSFLCICKMEMLGYFFNLYILNFDYCFLVICLFEGCFGVMFKLVKFFMCGISVMNLWIISVVLCKFVVLREF